MSAAHSNLPFIIGGYDEGLALVVTKFLKNLSELVIIIEYLTNFYTLRLLHHYEK